MKIRLGFQQAFMQMFNSLLQVFFRREEPAGLFASFFGCRGIQGGASSQHRIFDLPCDNRANASQVFTNRINLQGRTHQIFAIAIHVARFMPGRGRFFKAFSNRMPDIDGTLFLPVPVNTSIPLFHYIGVPWNFHMNHIVTVILQINSFGSRVCSQENTNRRIFG